MIRRLDNLGYRIANCSYFGTTVHSESGPYADFSTEGLGGGGFKMFLVKNCMIQT